MTKPSSCTQEHKECNRWIVIRGEKISLQHYYRQKSKRLIICICSDESLKNAVYAFHLEHSEKKSKNSLLYTACGKTGMINLNFPMPRGEQLSFIVVLCTESVLLKKRKPSELWG